MHYRNEEFDVLKENLIMLWKLKGFSQEKIAEKIAISRQAYGKWESGETIPDIEKCALLAEVYGVTIDSLIREYRVEDTPMAPAPEGKHIFGTAAISERGQIVIPKEVRDLFGLTGGCKLVILGDEKEGLALVRADKFEKEIKDLLANAGMTTDR